MHIVLMTDEVLPEARGGVAVVVEEARQELVQMGHRVTIVSTHRKTDRPFVTKEETQSGTVIRVRGERNTAQPFRQSTQNSKVTKAVEETLSELKPDVVHAHNVHEILGYRTLDAAKKVTDKVFLTAHDTFLVSFARVGGTRYEQAILERKPFRLRWWDSALQAGRRYAPLRNATIRAIIDRSVTNVFVYTDAMESFLEANGVPKVMKIGTGIGEIPSPDDATVKKCKENFYIDGPSVLFGARLSGDKGAFVFLDAAEKVLNQIPNAVFVVIGDIERWKPYGARASTTLNRQIRTIPWLTHPEMQVAYHAVDVVTVPSVYLDNFPTINLEAMRAGRPVVGTCFGGTPEAIVEGETGFIVNPRETDVYAERMVRLLQDPSLRESMGKNGQAHVRQVFSRTAATEGLVKLYLA